VIVVVNVGVWLTVWQKDAGSMLSDMLRSIQKDVSLKQRHIIGRKPLNVLQKTGKFHHIRILLERLHLLAVR